MNEYRNKKNTGGPSAQNTSVTNPQYKAIQLKDNRKKSTLEQHWQAPNESFLENEQGIVQRALIIGETDVTDEKINKKGKYKTKLNGVISEEANRAHLAPNKVRSKLTEMVNGNHHFGTMREAVMAAIGEITGVTAAEGNLGTQMDLVQGNRFNGYPKSQTWKMLMDGKHHGRGKYGFENEKGYMSALMNAYAHMLSTLGTQLTVDGYEQLHDMALQNVHDRKGKPMALGYRNNPLEGEGFGVDHDTWSREGYDELSEKYKNRKDHPVGRALAEDPKNMVGPQVGRKVMKLAPLYKAQCQRFASVVLGTYYTEIAHAANQDDQLLAIARCCQDLDQLHLFVDGNIRTIAFLVLNKLLLENGMDPVILDEPNIFDCKSVAQLRSAIRIGQAKFRSVRR